MPSRTSAPRWRAILLAAVRLAALYTIGTALLLWPIYLGVDPSHYTLDDLKEFATPIAIAFAGAFILLALARRAGLVALWLLLGGLWAWLLYQLGVGAAAYMPAAFLIWSALAIPLALLGALGLPATFRVPVGRWKPTALSLVTGLWAALLTSALGLALLPKFGIHPVREAAVHRVVADVAWFIWAPGAVLIVALSLMHVWIGTEPAKVNSAAA